MANIVAAAGSRAIHGDLFVVVLLEKGLKRLVGPVGIADQDVEGLGGDAGQPIPNLRIETADRPRTGKEHRLHRMDRVLVIVSTQTHTALP